MPFSYSTLSPRTEQCSPCDPSGAAHISPHITDVTFLTVQTFSSYHTLSSYYRCSNSGTVHFLLALHNLLQPSVTGPLKALPPLFFKPPKNFACPLIFEFFPVPIIFKCPPVLFLVAPTFFGGGAKIQRCGQETVALIISQLINKYKARPR